jgi:hypothetical protein
MSDCDKCHGAGIVCDECGQPEVHRCAICNGEFCDEHEQTHYCRPE